MALVMPVCHRDIKYHTPWVESRLKKKDMTRYQYINLGLFKNVTLFLGRQTLLIDNVKAKSRRITIWFFSQTSPAITLHIIIASV